MLQMTALAIPKEASAMPHAGDEKRFLAFLESQRRTLYKVAYFYCRDPEERRDLVQEIAIQLWRSFDAFDGRSSEATWTYRVATNVAITHRRREGRRIRDALPLDFAFDVADQRFDQDTGQSRQLRALIDGLDEMSRALVLFYLEGFDHSEIADLIGTTASNVGTRLNRIKAKLQSAAKE
ncbi:MAG: RNA polymerase sigma factor [Proteobacteria bacterium]|nr:RNA polymerase sigma factor [Pseudomonadota bacterium]